MMRALLLLLAAAAAATTVQAAGPQVIEVIDKSFENWLLLTALVSSTFSILAFAGLATCGIVAACFYRNSGRRRT